MSSYKQTLKDFLDELLGIGADNLTLSAVRRIIRENPSLYPKTESTTMINEINEILIGRESEEAE